MEVFGIKVNQPQYDDWKSKFNVVYDDDFETKVFETKETFKHDCDDDLNFEYKYLVEAVECEDKWYYSLNLVVLPKCLHKDVLDKIIHFVGREPDQITCEDVLSYGCGVMLCNDTLNMKFDVDDVMLKIANVVDCIDSLRGFYLDKHLNRIGTTGWDMINHCLFNENWIKL